MNSVVQYNCQRNHEDCRVGLLGCLQFIVVSFKEKYKIYANSYGQILEEDLSVYVEA